MFVVIIPAHNEAGSIGATLASVTAQDPAPDKIWVIADNCTDNTADVAYANGAHVVFYPHENQHKKAGALNQGLADLLPAEHLTDDDRVLIQDADTVLGPEFVSAAMRRLDRKPEVGAIGAVFYGEQGHGLLGQLQRNEFIRYSRELHHQRRTDRVRVLSGTASLFRVRVLRDIRAARESGQVPGPPDYYNVNAITEDNEITLATLTTGWKLLSPPQCAVETEIMPGLGRLWRQRIRWQRGAIENLREYGWTRVTWPYILRQGMMGLSVLALLFYFLFTAAATARVGHLTFSPLWIAVGLGFMLERVVTVRRGGWKAMLLAAPMLPELAYDMFQHAVYVTCIIKSALRLKQRW